MSLTYKTKPYKHQEQGIERFINETYGAFFCEMGTGKTKISIDLVCNNKMSDGVIVAAPNGLHRNWYHKELPVHANETDYLAYCWNGPPKTNKSLKEWNKFIRTDDDRKKFLLINVEALRTANGYDRVVEFIENRKSVEFIIDESTCIKNPKAIVTKACIRLGGLCDKRWILNGTPVTQGPLDLFSQCLFLHKNALPFKSYTAFKSYFAIEEQVVMQQRTFRKIVDYKNLSHLTAILAPFSLHLRKKDCLDLPEKVFVEHIVPMTVAQQRAYDQLKNLCLTMLDSGELMTAEMALVKLIRLHQITTGFFVSDEGTVTHLPNNRIEALLSIAETTRPIVIFCAYKENITQVTKALTQVYGDKSVVTYTGDSTGEERTNAVTAFQEGKVDFFVGSSAAAKGITLHRASSMVYFSNTYSLEHRLQSQDRIHRIGQVNKCTYTDLVSEGTVDTAILNALQGKKQIANTILNDLRHII